MWDNSDRLWNVKIDINADNGVYLLGSGSATGKSWLYNELDKMGKRYMDTVGYSYSDINETMESKIKHICHDNIPKVIMVDRYDMLDDTRKQDVLNTIEKYRNKSIILIDAKKRQGLNSKNIDDFAGMLLDKKTIEVEV